MELHFVEFAGALITSYKRYGEFLSSHGLICSPSLFTRLINLVDRHLTRATRFISPIRIAWQQQMKKMGLPTKNHSLTSHTSHLSLSIMMILIGIYRCYQINGT